MEQEKTSLEYLGSHLSKTKQNTSTFTDGEMNAYRNYILLL